MGEKLFIQKRKWCELQRHLSSNGENQLKPTSKSNLLLLVPVVTFGLGTWQVYRLKWKKNLIKELELKTSAEPTELPLNLDLQESMMYRRVKMVGEFDHSNELYLGPRPINKQQQGLASNKVGYHVITPFMLTDSGEKILVNRGWVPKKRLSPESRAEGQIEGPVEMTGIVRRPEERPPFVNRNDIEKNRWHYLDVNTMASVVGTLPIIVDSDTASAVPGGPIGGQTRVTLRNEHLQYIITWYALSAATMYLFYQLRKRPATMFSKGPR
eukprot:gene10653-19396_t